MIAPTTDPTLDSTAPDDARDRHAAAWGERWPRHCRACRGWGCVVAVDGAVTLCTALLPTQCHRCGGHGIPGDPAPCQYCGWEFDDGY